MGTALYVAAVNPAEEVIDILLDAGADLELGEGEPGTPLMGACGTDCRTILKTLVLGGATTSYMQDGQIFIVITAARLHPMVLR